MGHAQHSFRRRKELPGPPEIRQRRHPADAAEDVTSATQTPHSGEEATPTETSELPPSQTASEPVPASLGGSWSFTLNDSVQRDLALTLFQTDSNLFGAGKIREGNNTLDVTVSGSVPTDETVQLDVTTANPISLYKLNLNSKWRHGLRRLPGILPQRRLLEGKRRGPEDGLGVKQTKCRETGICATILFVIALL